MITKVLSGPEKAQSLAGAYAENTGKEHVLLGVWVRSSEICIPLTREQADALGDQLKASAEGNTHVFVDAELIAVQGEG